MTAAARDYRPPLVALRALGLGDLLTIVPALRALRRFRADCRLVLATPAALHPLVAIANLADNSIDVPDLRAFRTRLPVEAAYNLHGRGPQSHRVLLALRPREFVAFAHDDVPSTTGMPVWNAGEHEVERWCRLLEATGTPCDPTDLNLDAEDFEPFAPSIAYGATVIHAGAGAVARQWPVERFTAVARRELHAGNPVVVTGSARERGRAEAIARGSGLGPEHVLAGRTDILQLAGTIAVSGRVVAGDTGVAHLATAFARPSVVLFGPVPPSEWGPPPRPWHVPLWRGRHGNPHGNTTDPGLLDIAVEDVMRALARLQDSFPKTRLG